MAPVASKSQYYYLSFLAYLFYIITTHFMLGTVFIRNNPIAPVSMSMRITTRASIKHCFIWYFGEIIFSAWHFLRSLHLNINITVLIFQHFLCRHKKFATIQSLRLENQSFHSTSSHNMSEICPGHILNIYTKKSREICLEFSITTPKQHHDMRWGFGTGKETHISSKHETLPIRSG